MFQVFRLTCSFSFHGIPDVTIKIIVTSQEQPSWFAEGDAGDATYDIIVTVHGQFLVRPDVEQSACGIVTARRERVPVREEGDGVYVRFVAGEGLLAQALSDVPQFGGGVARPRHESSHVVRQRQRHHVAGVTQERGDLLAGFYVPEGARHVPAAGHYLIVVQETTTGQVTGVARQFPAHTHVTLSRLQTVNRAYVVQTAARHETTRRGVCARHHPRRSQRNRMNLANKNKTIIVQTKH